jgi:hypothetical protein
MDLDFNCQLFSAASVISSMMAGKKKIAASGVSHTHQMKKGETHDEFNERREKLNKAVERTGSGSFSFGSDDDDADDLTPLERLDTK